MSIKLSKWTITILVLMLFFVIGTKSSNAQDVDTLVETISLPSEVYDSDINNNGVLATTTEAGVQIYDTDNWQMLASIVTDNTAYSVSWDNSGKLLAVAEGTAEVKIWSWDGIQFSLVTTLQTVDNQRIVSWSPDGSYLVTVGFFTDQQVSVSLLTLQVWNTSIWQLAHQIETQFAIISTHGKNSLIDWSTTDINRFAIVGTPAHLEGNIFHPDDPNIKEPRVFILNAATGIVETSVDLLMPFGYSVSWCGDYLAVGGQLGFDVYRISTGEYLSGYGVEINVSTLAWNTSCRYVISNNTLYDTATSQTHMVFFPVIGGITDARWYTDGQHIFIISSNPENVTELYVHDLTKLDGFILPRNES